MLDHLDKPNNGQHQSIEQFSCLCGIVIQQILQFLSSDSLLSRIKINIGQSVGFASLLLTLTFSSKYMVYQWEICCCIQMVEYWPTLKMEE